MKQNVFWTLILLVVLIIGFGMWYGTMIKASVEVPTTSQPDQNQYQNVVGEGQHCGGNMRNTAVCEPGLRCVPTPGSSLPLGDVGGICIAQ